MLNPKINIVVPTRNSENFIEKCLQSVLCQTYSNWTLTIGDDLSTDRTKDLIQKVIDNNQRHSKDIIFYSNTERLYPLRNFLKAVEITPPEDKAIIVTLDGDDSFFSEEALMTLKSFYEEDNMLDATYGGFKACGKSEVHCRLLESFISNNPEDPRSFIHSHLRSFKRFLLKAIPLEYYTKAYNEYPKRGGDYVLTLAVHRLARHVKKVQEPVYLWNLDDSSEHAFDYAAQCELVLKREKGIPFNVETISEGTVDFKDYYIRQVENSYETWKTLLRYE